MALEATMICVDNSEFMRNSDYLPSRLVSQQDCTHYIANVRLGANPESTVGVVSMAGKGVEMLVSPTGEKNTVLNALSQIKIEGKTDILVSIQIANLALAHRRNTHGGKRIIIFIGSPLTDTDPAKLHRLSLQLKKNNVAVDIVSLGEGEENLEILTTFVNTVSTNDNSSLVVIGAGENVSPLDQIKRSASLGRGGVQGDGGAVGGGGGGFGADGGFDDVDDPDMAMAIRISLEQSRAEAEAAARDGAIGSSGDDAPSSGEGQNADSSSAATVAGASSGMMDTGMDFDDDPELAAAMALSMQGMDNLPPASVADVKGEDAAEGEEDDDEDYDEDLAAAMALSMEGDSSSSSAAADMPPKAPNETAATTTSSGVVDPDFVREMLGSVGDLDPDDPLIAAALAQINSQSNSSADKGGNSNGDKKRKESDK